MSEYLPPCFSIDCPASYPPSDATQNLCRNMSGCIIGAGGAGLLEATICPMVAVQAVAPEQEDEAMVEIRSKLGIVGYFERESSFE